MSFANYISESVNLLTHPFITINRIYFRFNDTILRNGLITSLMGRISLALSGLIIANETFVRNPQFIVDYLLFVVIIGYIIEFIAMAIMTFVLGMAKKELKVGDFAGLYFSSEFLNILLLPLAIILVAIPSVGGVLYAIVSFALFVMVFLLKVRSISISCKASDAQSFGVMFIPLLVVMITLMFTTGYLFSLIKNLFV